jgi:Nucleotide modification associated domain 1
LSRDELFEKVLDEIGTDVIDTVKRKNRDYGNSFENIFNKYGMTSLLIRFADKTERLDSLVLKGNEQHVKDESIEDTLKDICGYALLALTVMQKKKEKAEAPRTPLPQIKNVVPHFTVENSLPLGKALKHEGLHF